jgi:hypothetical protein
MQSLALDAFPAYGALPASDGRSELQRTKFMGMGALAPFPPDTGAGAPPIHRTVSSSPSLGGDFRARRLFVRAQMTLVAVRSIRVDASLREYRAPPEPCS